MLSRSIKWVLLVVVLMALVSFSVTYTVRFTEAGVLTTFGAANAGSVKTEPGLKFKWPYPIQSVTKYDTRVRALNLRMEAQQTSDRRQVIIEGFCFWRVTDPLKFFQRFSNAGERAEDHYKAAETALIANIRASSGLTSQYAMSDLFGTAGASKLPELEKRMGEAVRATADNKTGLSLADYGIVVEDVGIQRLVLPEEVTKAVFDRMKAARAKITAETESIGKSQADAIRATADADARKITQFAERLAQNIRSQGDNEAVPFYAQMQKNPSLAVYLEELNFVRTAYSQKGATIVVPADLPGFRMLSPSMSESLRSGEIPTPGGDHWLRKAMEPAGAGGSARDPREIAREGATAKAAPGGPAATPPPSPTNAGKP